MLERSPNGAFVVRRSGSTPNSFVLVYRFQGNTRNTHIHGSPQGLKLTKVQQCFPTLTEFITFYGTRWSAEIADLPCQLLLPPDFQRMSDALSKKQQKEQEKKKEKAAREQAKQAQKKAGRLARSGMWTMWWTG